MENVIQSPRPAALVRLLGLGLLLGGVLAAGEVRAATTAPNDISGVICRPIKGSQVDYAADGVINRSANVVAVECAVPMGIVTNQTLVAIVVTAYRRNSSELLLCELTELDPFSGNILWQSGLKHAGAASNNPSLMGFFVPATENIANPWRVNCALPAVTSMGPSQIAAIHISTK
jgi:hypothetical protein